MIMEKVSIKQYKQRLPELLKQRTLCFLIKDGQVLLGQKKRGFGQGYWLGIGGKVESGENVKEAARREMKEEVGVELVHMDRVATLDFYFPYVEEPKKWNQQVCVFVANTWHGDPKESEEINPRWFKVDNIPIDLMWDDAHYWLPKVLQGIKLTAEFTFDRDLKVEEVNTKEKS